MSVDFDRLREVFFAAAEQPPPEQAAYLDRACAGDEELRRNVAVMLKAHAAGEGPLDRGAFRAGPTGADHPGPDGPGTVIGPYKLLQVIGEGGMGTVYLAEQAQPVQRKVALKVIKPGMDTAQVIARFEAERQALALMDHPNIAKVHDAGTTDGGRPYFVMELVKGVPITAYCDEQKLALKERLGLFVGVCQAVQHAHQKGIIHRDIKPSNVMIARYDGRPVPKVIDFGIAKATGARLTERTLFTAFGAVVGTLEYMSPEQAELNNLDVDTRSDVYSLGVLLYELLTGTTPLEHERLEKAGLLEALRIIREEETPLPSARLSTAQELPTIAANRGLAPKRLSGLVRGELDWIALKALEKDRARRYESANGLARDVERYLRDEPVLACPPSAWYRCRKFARRNRRALTTAALLGLMLLALAGALGWAARDRAAREARAREDVEAAAQGGETHLERALALTDDSPRWGAALAAAGADLKRAEALAGDGRQLTPALRARVQALADRLRDGEKDHGLVAAAERIRLEQSDPNVKENRFSRGEAAPRYQEAFAAYGLPALTTPPEEAAALLADKPPALRAVLVAALDDWLMVCEARPQQRVWLQAVLAAADSDAWRKQVRAALLADDRPALKALEALARHPEALRQPPATLSMLGNALHARGATPSAVRLLRQARERHPADFWINNNLANALGASRPPRHEEAIAAYRIALALRPRSAGVYLNFGSALEAAGDVAGAVAAFRKAIDMAPDYAWAHSRLGMALRARHDLDGAVAAQRRAVELAPNDGRFQHNLGGALRDRGDVDGAIAAYRKAMQLGPQDPMPHNNLGLILMERNDLPGAVASFRKAIALGSRSVWPRVNLSTALGAQGDLPGAIDQCRKAIAVDPGLPEAHYNLGVDLYKSKDLPGAVAAYRKALELRPDYAHAWYNLGIALTDQKELRGAVAAFRKAVEIKPGHVAAHNDLGRALEDVGDLSGAAAHFRKAIALSPKLGDAHYNLGNVLLKKKDLPGAVAAYHQAIDLGPKLAGAHNNLGLALRAQGDLPGAAAAFRKAIALDPKFVQAHNNLGDTLMTLGNLRGAVVVFRRATALDPKYVPAHNNLGLALRLQGRLADAEAAFQKALDLAPNFAEAHNNLGIVRKLQGDLPAALACFRKALAARPNHVDALLNLSSGLCQQGAYAEATGHLFKARELAPNNVYPRFYQAMAYLGAGDLEAHRRECAGLVERFGKTTDQMVAIRVLYACVMAPGAVADPAALVGLAEATAAGSGGLDRLLGAAHYRAGNSEAAVRHFERLARVGELQAWDFYFLALAHQRLGHAEDARRWLDRGARWADAANRQEAEGKRSPWGSWFARVAAEHLRREAEATNKGKAPARPAPKEKGPPPDRP
jgi:tetratricopeptide (TPR) repeat protein